MAPPSFSDIGKQARDVFGKGYHFGLVKLDVKSKTSSGVEFTAAGNTTTDGGKVGGSLETKYKVADKGLSLTEKWSTDNSLNTTVDYDKLVPGLKLTLDAQFLPVKSSFGVAKFKTEYKHEKLLFNADVNLAQSPVVNLATSVGHGPYALGYKTAFKTGESTLANHNLALAYNAGDLIIHATASDAKVFGGGVFIKNSPKLETGVTLSSAESGSTFAVGCKYTLGPDASVRAKVNNASQVGLSYQQKLRDGVTLTMSTNIDGTKLNEPGHKLGLALEMEA